MLPVAKGLILNDYIGVRNVLIKSIMKYFNVRKAFLLSEEAVVKCDEQTNLRK